MAQGNHKHVTVQTTDDFIKQCRDVFSVFDPDGAGTITQYKLSEVMKAYGWPAEHGELQKMISEIDRDNNGYITLEEFIPLMNKIVHEDVYLEEELNQVFINFGYNESLLASDALKSKLLIASNGSLSEEEIQDLTLQIHKDADAPFDCENAAKIVLDKIRSKGCKTRRTSSRYKSLRLKTAAMFGIANKRSISDQHSQSSFKKVDRVLTTQK